MLSNFQNLLLVLVGMTAAGGFLIFIQRIWPTDLRRLQNDLVGWNVTVLGTIYGVMVGFMLFAVWSDFQTANSNAESEANALVNVVRTSRGLPAPQRAEILRMAKEYVDIMLTREWPAMMNYQLSPESHLIVRNLWANLTASETHTVREQISLDHTLTEMAKMTEFRRLRQWEVTAHLPGVLWVVLILGAIVTIVSACLFGAADSRAHLLQVTMLSLIISSVLVAIADIDRPFEGAVHVDPNGFERARISLNDIP